MSTMRVATLIMSKLLWQFWQCTYALYARHLKTTQVAFEEFACIDIVFHCWYSIDTKMNLKLTAGHQLLHSLPLQYE